MYEDRLPPDGINTPDHRPLREFFKLSVMGLIAIVLLGFLLNSAGGTLGGFIPFKYELWLTEKIDAAAVKSGEESPFATSNANPELQTYLQSVADRVTSALGVDESIPITLHYSDDSLVNAYATIGGHVDCFRGLLRLLPHENALAMLMAHEISHVTLRHTAKGLGGGLAVVIGSSMVGLAGDNKLFGFGSQLTSTSFSRKMEAQADRSALEALNKMYGHVAGADALFKLFMQQRKGGDESNYTKFLSTHPLDEDRIKRIQELASEFEWQAEGVFSPLPANYKQWVNVQ